MLTSVGGSLSIEAQDTSLPALATVGGGCLYIRADGTSLPALAAVSGDLYIRADGASLPALAAVGCSLYICPGIQFDHSKIEFGHGEVLAVSEYALHLKDGLYRAGCRGPWTAEQALAHWSTAHPVPARATLFRAAIIGHN